ncbi:MAG TPA: hypothetical protein VML55_06705 [Planctomycetaceae bacterium]|nr:hypothetical protein [Planctomycetaceae bacterium]
MSISITIENLDPLTFSRLEEAAARRGSDVPSTAAELLRSSLGVRQVHASPERARDLAALAGTWTDEEADAFLARIADFSRIDEELWK